MWRRECKPWRFCQTHSLSFTIGETESQRASASPPKVTRHSRPLSRPHPGGWKTRGNKFAAFFAGGGLGTRYFPSAGLSPACPGTKLSSSMGVGVGCLQAGVDEDRGSLVSSEKVSLISFEQKWKGPHSFIQHMFIEHLLCARLHACLAGHLSPGTECLRGEGSEGPLLRPLSPVCSAAPGTPPHSPVNTVLLSSEHLSALLDSPCPQEPALPPPKNNNLL